MLGIYFILYVFFAIRVIFTWVRHFKVKWNVSQLTRLKSQGAHQLQFAFFQLFFCKSCKWSCCSNTLRNVLTFTAQFEPLRNIKLKWGMEFRRVYFLSQTVQTFRLHPQTSRSQGHRRVSFTILKRESWVICVPPDYFWKLFLLHWPESKPPK